MITSLLIAPQLTLEKDSKEMLVVAHRGYSSKAPENTMAAFDMAIAAGADYFECDVHKCKSGEIVVIHDETVDKTTNGSGLVSDFTLEQLKELSAGYSDKFGDQFESERIPTLEEVMKLAKGQIKVEIEIKAQALAAKVVKLVKELKMEQDVIIISFDYNEVKAVKELAPEIETMYLVGAIWGKKELDMVKKIGAEYIGPNGIPSKGKVKMAHEMGIKVLPYTINDEKAIAKALRNGVDGIATDYPEKAIELRSKSN
jgi:glycerophosphoryl diester phosphodiesterase